MNKKNDSFFLDQKKQELSRLLLTGQKIRYECILNDTKSLELTFHLAIIALSKLYLTFLNEVIITYIHEIIANAAKANLKRIFFKRKNADIRDAQTYERLIKEFRKEAMHKSEEFLDDLKKENLIVQITMQLTESQFSIDIDNNSPLLPTEKERITQRISKASEKENIMERFLEISDKVEGAGLGLVFLLTALKNVGIGSNSFTIRSDDKFTYTNLTIPVHLNKPENIQKIQDILTEEIDNIPSFPDSVLKLISICDDPKSSMKQVSDAIEKDLGLASDILKLSNSAIFTTAGKVNTISKAVLKLGIQVIRQFVVATVSKKIINSHFKTYKSFWEHALKCAFYAKNIALRFNLKKVSDTMFLGGLLHDIGKIVIFSVKPKMVEQIIDLTMEGVKVSSSFLEETSIGISHTKIGAQIAQKWRFTDDLKNMILYHHSPGISDEKYKNEAAIIHIADAFTNIERKRGRYYLIDSQAANMLGLEGESEIEKLHDYVLAAYNKYLDEKKI